MNSSCVKRKMFAWAPRARELMVAIVAGSALFAASAQAVNLNPRGLGEVLIFPYYATTGQHDTYINLVNTRDETKALKVRFRESMNGAVVLEMNLYLAPHDHWSAVVYPQAGGPGVELRTVDRSCTVPLSIYEGEPMQLSNEKYQGDSSAGFERTREGFIEVIEMAVISPGSTDWPSLIRHRPTGNAINCSAIASAWGADGAWQQDPEDGASPATGGVYGYGVLIDVEDGTEGAYDAIALDNFREPEATLSLHTAPDSSLPSLASGEAAYEMLVNGDLIASTASSGVDAVSALLMQASFSNDFVTESTVDASTDWVITFPTKHLYINDGVARAPFSSVWSAEESAACEPSIADYFDREAREDDREPSLLSAGGRPVFLGGPLVVDLCAQANVLGFNTARLLEAASERNGVVVSSRSGFVNGWVTITFEDDRPSLNAGDFAFKGLPVIGFALQRYVNGSIAASFDTQPVLANYVGVIAHKGRVVVEGL